MEHLSNHIKALLVAEDITEGIPVSQNHCYTVQHFNYHCYRVRDAFNTPCDPTQSSLMRFTIRVLPDIGGKVFYQRLNESERSTFTLVFNATFSPSRMLQDYEDAMIVSGYVVNIEEQFTGGSNPDEANKTDGMLMTIEFLLSTITYVGFNSNKTLCITK